MNRKLELVAHAQATQFGTLAAIDMAFGGKGKAFDAYQEALLKDEGEGKKGMTQAAEKFFGGDGLSGLVPTVRVKRPALPAPPQEET